MSDKTNEEKLKILHDRLNHIKQKQEKADSPKEKTENIIDNSSIESEKYYVKRRSISFCITKICCDYYLYIFSVLCLQQH